jgi:PAS domain S-box-containing protein
MPCILSAKKFRSPEGDIVGIVVNIKDITDRKKAEEEKLSREKFVSSNWI